MKPRLFPNGRTVDAKRGSESDFYIFCNGLYHSVNGKWNAREEGVLVGLGVLDCDVTQEENEELAPRKGRMKSLRPKIEVFLFKLSFR